MRVLLLWACTTEYPDPCTDPSGTVESALRSPDPDMRLLSATRELKLSRYYYCGFVVDPAVRSRCQRRAARVIYVESVLPGDECLVPRLAPDWVAEVCPSQVPSRVDLRLNDERQAVTGCRLVREHLVTIEMVEHGPVSVCVDGATTAPGTPERCLAEFAGSWRLEDFHGPGTYEAVVSPR